jgi:predicted TIM-barrel fold metal-dependent hydrolase
MHFYDCNLSFGLPTRRPLLPVPEVTDLLGEMERAGVERGLVWHIVQHDGSPQIGNAMLSAAIRPYENLTGCWAILPNQGKEFPPVAEFCQQMKAARISAIRLFPGSHRFLLNAVALGDWLEAFSERRIPLLLSMKNGVEWRDVYALLADFPELVCVICDHGCWGEDRLFRPLLERYPHVYVDTAHYLLDGGIEGLVETYGPDRLLFGSGFPDCYFGGMMLALRHAQIAEEAKSAIACGNLDRILSEVRL